MQLMRDQGNPARFEEYNICISTSLVAFHVGVTAASWRDTLGGHVPNFPGQSTYCPQRAGFVGVIEVPRRTVDAVDFEFA